MLATIDIIIIVGYALGLFAVAQWVSREKAGHTKDSKDYFLAGGSLPWWAIGASLIAANISAEQIIGMSGSGYAIGLAIASYEWLAAITLIIVGKFLLPIFLKNKIYTMPQFLEQRYDHRVRILMACFWLIVYVFVNLTAILWLGALAANTVIGVNLTAAMIGLAAFALAYSIYGGLKAVAMTDIIQVIILILGGLFIVDILFAKVAGENASWVEGFVLLMDEAPQKFDMILDKSSEHYSALPGLSVILGGMWVMHFSYWGFNQYIIQRALGAKSLEEAQKGILFAAFLKILMPIIVVLPGIAIFLLDNNLAKPDQAYPIAMTYLPAGLKGLAFAALLAAIVSSLASMVNSISTIFVKDVMPSITEQQDEAQQVKTGRIAAVVAMLIATVIAQPLLGQFDQAFQFIQEITGFFTPGIVVLFVLGMFYAPMNTAGALVAAVSSVVLSIAFKLLLPEFPFIDRVGVVFIASVVLAILVSHLSKLPSEHNVNLDDIKYDTTSSFNIYATVITLIIASFYVVWW